MKKFYESPVVEITVFDVEDVITASVNTSTLETEAIDAYVAEIADNYVAPENTATTFGNFGSYTW